MAKGDIVNPAGFVLAMGQERHHLGSDAFKLALITSVTTPSINDADPRWAAGGSVNFDTNECTAGGNYPAEGISLTSVSWTIVSNIPTFRADDITIAQHASNPTNARWGIIYNNTDTNKGVVAFIDLGAVTDLTAGPTTFNFGGAGTDIFTMTPQP
jgi:hypothetical protein